MIVHLIDDMHHAKNQASLFSFNRNLYNLSGDLTRIVDNKTTSN